MARHRRPIHLIAGPTASGKSAKALDIAVKDNAVIINADSMQVYSVLRIITARPDDADMAKADHKLYGHIDPATPYSTGKWLRECEALLVQLPPEQPLVFIGGTGLYFKALLGGLSPIPEIPDNVRQRWRYRLAEEGAQKLHRVLRGADPEMAMTLAANDGQRILRALEVMEVTGKSIQWWQTQPGKPIIDEDATIRQVILPERSELHARINRRFEAMAHNGALNEVRALRKRNINAAVPARKAIGVPELTAYLDGETTLEAAIERAQAATRQYAKRQVTWLRNQMGPKWRNNQ